MRTASFALLLSTASAAAVERAASWTANLHTPQAFAAPSGHDITDNYIVIEKGAATSRSASVLQSLRNKLNKRATTASAPLIPLQGQEYLTQLQFGSNPKVKVIVDTGSSDTWLIQSGFKCVDANGNSVSEATCNFGPVYAGGYTGGQIANQNFNISYGDGEFVTGTLGYSDVTVAGLTVKNQEVALGNYLTTSWAYWNGDATSSGLIGLAYKALTSAFAGTNPKADTQRINYDPIFTSMYKQGLTNATFSLAIERGSAGGYIAFGGLPPVSFTQSFTSTPIQTLSIAGSSQYTFYTINVGGYNVGSKTYGAGTQAIVDSGTTLTYLPSTVAKAANAAFSPAAVLDNAEGGYFVKCTATAPKFSVAIGGTNFLVSAQDLIFQNIKNSAGLCLTGIQDGGSQGPFILGDVFLQNVVAVFDVGASQMRFAAHTTY